eukprot:15362243-Ditylum_brightwellii.AAC.1
MEELITVKRTTSTRIRATGATAKQQAAYLGARLTPTAMGVASMSKTATAGACNRPKANSCTMPGQCFSGAHNR